MHDSIITLFWCSSHIAGTVTTHLILSVLSARYGLLFDISFIAMSLIDSRNFWITVIKGKTFSEFFALIFSLFSYNSIFISLK